MFWDYQLTDRKPACYPSRGLDTDVPVSVISGGGFRDSLADMSEELCPSSADTPVPLPFFVRTANQVIVSPPTHHQVNPMELEEAEEGLNYPGSLCTEGKLCPLYIRKDGGGEAVVLGVLVVGK